MKLNEAFIPGEMEIDEAVAELQARKVAIIGDYPLGDVCQWAFDGGHLALGQTRNKLAAIILLLVAECARKDDEIANLKRAAKEADMRFRELEMELALEHEMIG